MKLITFWRVLKLGWNNYWRNRGLSISATLIVTLTLVTVSSFFLARGVLQATSAKIHDKIDVKVTFDDQVAETDIQALKKVIADRPEAKEVQFVTKEEAAARFHGLSGVSQETKDLVTKDNNPLPRSLEIKATTPEGLGVINLILNQQPWKDIVRRNSYDTNREDIQKITRFERGLTFAGLVLSIIFALISLVVVINTIRLAIFARREEIEIMRLVGANNIFIRIPFVVEAILYALAAAVLAMLATWGAVYQLGPILRPFLGEIDFNLLTMYTAQLPLLIALELGVGLGLAIFASLFSIQRYMKR